MEVVYPEGWFALKEQISLNPSCGGIGSLCRGRLPSRGWIGSCAGVGLAPVPGLEPEPGVVSPRRRKNRETAANRYSRSSLFPISNNSVKLGILVNRIRVTLTIIKKCIVLHRTGGKVCTKTSKFAIFREI